MRKGSHHKPESIQKNKNKHLGQPSNKKDKKYEEIYGSERAKELKQILRDRNLGKSSSRKNKTYEEIYGSKRAAEIKKKWREKNLGKQSPFKGKKRPELVGERNGMYGKPSPLRNTHPSSKTRQRLHVAKIEQWKNKEIAKKMRAGLRPSGPELYLDFLLQNYFPDEWWFVGDGKINIDGLCPDFINVNGKKLLIEHFGEHWHKGENEQVRKERFAKFDYSTLVLWGHELRDENEVIEKIRSFSNV